MQLFSLVFVISNSAVDSLKEVSAKLLSLSVEDIDRGVLIIVSLEIVPSFDFVIDRAQLAFLRRWYRFAEWDCK